ncbi:MAG: 2-oxo acid dehydrogenase [Capnocytophaga sp.]|nr:MAG: 2-oxo acid dehydrogenase [Capnocytophaga sp.]
MARYELKLPQMGESVEEATVSSWLKKVGDTIKVDDILVEVATDKVDSEIPSEVSGVITEILTPEKTVVKVGQLMAIIETDQENAQPIELPASQVIPLPAQTQVQPLTETPQPQQLPIQPQEIEPAQPIEQQPVQSTEERPVQPIEEIPTSPQAEEALVAQVPYVPQEPITLPEVAQEEADASFYSPLVKTIAKEENISMEELASIQGSGIGGRVTKNDLFNYLERRDGKTATALAPVPTLTQETTSLTSPAESTDLTTQITDVTLIDDKLGGSPFSATITEPTPIAPSHEEVAAVASTSDASLELLTQQKEESTEKDHQEEPLVAHQEVPVVESSTTQEETPAPVVELPVSQEEASAPVAEIPTPEEETQVEEAPMAHEETPAVAQEEKTQAQEVKYPDISDFIKNFEATHAKETPVAEKEEVVETPVEQLQPITIEPTPISLEIPQDKPEEKPVVATTTYTPSPVDKNVEVIEMTRMGKLIANYMIESKRVSAHATSFIEVDVTRIWNWRNKHKKAFEAREGEKLTFTPIFIEAVAKALRDFPLMNISTDGERIFKKKQINIGMATALPNGDLIVPVIKNADQLSLVGLAKNVNDLAKRARENKLKPDEVKDGTYTVTNIGAFGNLFGTPILNQPQVGILAIGAIQKVPAVVETPEGDVIAIRYKLMLSHSFDHRVVNGALGGMFVQRVAQYLEQWDINREI